MQTPNLVIRPFPMTNSENAAWSLDFMLIRPETPRDEPALKPTRVLRAAVECFVTGGRAVVQTESLFSRTPPVPRTSLPSANEGSDLRLYRGVLSMVKIQPCLTDPSSVLLNLANSVLRDIFRFLSSIGLSLFSLLFFFCSTCSLTSSVCICYHGQT